MMTTHFNKLNPTQFYLHKRTKAIVTPTTPQTHGSEKYGVVASIATVAGVTVAESAIFFYYFSLTTLTIV